MPFMGYERGLKIVMARESNDQTLWIEVFFSEQG